MWLRYNFLKRANMRNSVTRNLGKVPENKTPIANVNVKNTSNATHGETKPNIKGIEEKKADIKQPGINFKAISLFTKCKALMDALQSVDITILKQSFCIPAFKDFVGVPRVEAFNKIIKAYRFEAISSILFCGYAYCAYKYTKLLPTMNSFLKYCTTDPNVTKSNIDLSRNSTKTQHGTENPKINTSQQNTVQGDKSNGKKTPEKLRIILIGASGSGKSSVGNRLLKKDEAFQTSWYARSETKQSVLKTSDKIEVDSKEYSVDIIDTPAYENTEMSHLDVENEIKRAKKLSSPKPDAFLFCIPVDAMRSFHTDALKPFEKYFDDNFDDCTVVVITNWYKTDSKSFDEKENKIKFKSELRSNRLLTNRTAIERKCDFHWKKNKDHELNEIVKIILETRERIRKENEEEKERLRKENEEKE